MLMKVHCSPDTFINILPVWKVVGHVLTFVVNRLMLSTLDTCIQSINYDSEKRSARQNKLHVVTQIYEHNCCSKLCNNPNLSKKPKLDTTILHPFLEVSPVKILIRAISVPLKCPHYLNSPEDFTSSAN